ncbi:WD40-like Beta Propeller Repeat [Mariprofundus ferrinatatus]|uniref:WD40-like Beta Propeller Repeat n=1 Tax=Mariprofundus ferrinatatus TaxID=1921087 RepID=A0A2K8L108_9PROT|nr:PD40 domain-containing protein [Mariprofundus ferrinatatus]ATX80967.1 WD40-like Beta Propeller Repeat [Mariprofundus ferrinatatus]
MRKILYLSLGLIAAAPAAQAENVLEWLDSMNTAQQGKASEPADAAVLLTLENRESEMYPQPAPNGKYLLTLTQSGKNAWISRRLTENGDPANMVTDDVHTVDSIGWKDDGHVYYLSERAGGLGLWEKISDGEGMQRRIQSLHGALTQPILLSDGSIVAVRAKPLNYKPTKMKKTSQVKRDEFNNWEFPGFATEIVRFHGSGSQQVLSEGINPALSPDGNSIVFAMAAGRSVHLFRMNIDGSNLIQITDARSIDVQPSWSKDGKWIIFTSNRAEADMRHKGKSQWDIWAIGIDGRNLTQISFDDAKDGAPRMGSDGRIYFHSDRKVSREMSAQHQVKSVGSHDFHIWIIDWPNQAK